MPIGNIPPPPLAMPLQFSQQINGWVDKNLALPTAPSLRRQLAEAAGAGVTRGVELSEARKLLGATDDNLPAAGAPSLLMHLDPLECIRAVGDRVANQGSSSSSSDGGGGSSNSGGGSGSGSSSSRGSISSRAAARKLLDSNSSSTEDPRRKLPTLYVIDSHLVSNRMTHMCLRNERCWMAGYCLQQPH